MGDTSLIEKVADVSLVAYCVSPGEQFLVSLEISTIRPAKTFVRVKKLNEERTPTRYELGIQLSSSTIEKNSFQLQLVQASTVVKGKAELHHYIIVNTGDAIHLVSLETLFSASRRKTFKWAHYLTRDTITSFFAFNVQGSALQVVYGTTLGTLVIFEFNILTESFRKIEEKTNAAADSFATCEPCLPSGLDPEAIYIPELIFASYDNYLYSLEKGIMQKLPLIESALGGDTLVSGAGVVAKQYTTKSLRYYAVNILNSGCHLFKRGANGNWESVRIFVRNERQENEEKSPLVNCQVVSRGRTQVCIITGSEHGKIYFWQYDYRDDTITQTIVLEVAHEVDVVHSLKIANGKTIYYMVNRDFVGSQNLP
ncbi:LADA_0F06766g1_1 [Lachancea dasiensis]|uniref:LADA_0F06766g1_1 n=1 Tax=Lachancea dasiensis TaxID=1072105 RepID=A0A1G4JK24_9SACH|nr:LADA_0F06766g1_1 [Lachancea dasiensis]